MDPASVTIGKAVADLGGFRPEGNACGFSLYRSGDAELVRVPGLHIFQNNLDSEIEEAFGIRPETLIFLSTHRSERNIPAITFHPLGNYGTADLGGISRRLVHSPSSLLTSSMIQAAERGRGNGYEITFEATHHGPYLECQAFFAEIGSNMRAWTDGKAAALIAESLLNATQLNPVTAVGIGGGHYCPRFRDIAIRHRISFAHFIPNYALRNIDGRLADEVLEKSGKPTILAMHISRGFEEEAERVATLFLDRGLDIFDPSREYSK
ncbi:MAG: hypothetical protein KIY12_05820 [Thermoplasmata archaeon]|uniref:D-aminoacyl-tRNA deacylase n=1 Tax=Candidatus Sysuiplasma superficiale TaxID=2823368 RepID=A0A8J7YNF7_9ARCH|nr:hypothetical protein [Candidatus Sysuiplasma superficiale]MBX8644223.1 hypothetical protein [Candidatus Sysuiplasma superficiale]MCL5437525.1 hypothetical protein [Candidatus Thermoplasmatota archaeon]